MNLDAVNPLHQEIARLRDRVAELEETLRQEREAFAPVVVFPSEWKLSAAESSLVRALYSATMIPNDGLFRLVSRGRAEHSDRLHHIVIAHARAKLKPYGIKIENIHSVGYRLPPASKDIIRAAVERENKPYDAEDDMRKSVEYCLGKVRERKASGGPSWPRMEAAE